MRQHTVRASMAGIASTALVSATMLVGVAAPAEARSSSFPAVCSSAGKILCVDKSSRVVRLLENGRTLYKLDARFGNRREPTRNGMFRVFWKNADHVSSLFGSAMPFAMFFSGGQAIHYSSDFLRNGYNGASHGCVNTRAYSAMRSMYYATPVGTRVYVYYS
ncbi:MAG: L,D-transpeptidase [Sporichthyaceae bacterium]